MPVAYQAPASISNNHIALGVSEWRATLSLFQGSDTVVDKSQKKIGKCFCFNTGKQNVSTSEEFKLWLCCAVGIFQDVGASPSTGRSTLRHQLIGISGRLLGPLLFSLSERDASHSKRSDCLTHLFVKRQP